MRSCDVLVTKPSELAFYPVPKLFIRRIGGHEQWGAIHSAEIGDGTLECRDIPHTLQMIKLFKDDDTTLADMCGNIAVKHEVLPAVDTTIEEDIAARLSALNSEMMARVSELDAYLKDAEKISDVLVAARYYRDNVVTTMEKIRAAADEMETSCDSSYWPMPAYGELLFSIK